MKKKHKQGGEKKVDAYKDWSSLGDGIDSINNPREIAEKGQQQTNPKLDLNY